MRRGHVLALLAVAEFMLTLDLSIVNVALPAIRSDLGFGAGSLPWVVNAYALAFGGFLLLGGRAADLFGGRRVFVGALATFSVASLACGLAAGPVALVVARLAQGVSAGVLSPATLSILTSTYREQEARNRALSIWTAVAIGGGAVGGLIGGVLVDAISWRAIFFVNVPIGAVLLVLAAAGLSRSSAVTHGRPLDLPGAVSVTAGLSALVWALARSAAVGWGSPEVLGGLLAAGMLLAAFLVIEARVAAPLVPFSAFRSRSLSVGNVLSFLSFVPVMATWFLLSLHLQRDRGYSPVEAGLVFLPMSLAVIGGSQAGFRGIARVGARLLFAAGGLAAAGALAWLSRLSAGTALAWLLVPACLAMIGGGLMFAPITVAATSGVPADQGGLASGLLNTTRQIGGALGLAVLGTIAAAHGSGPAFGAGAVVYAATAIAGGLLLPTGLGRAQPAGGAAPRRVKTRASVASSSELS